MSVQANPPQLKAGNADYQEDAKFKSEVSLNSLAEKEELLLKHYVSSGNLVYELLQQKKACYACEVVSPRSSFRQLYIASRSEGASQKITIDPGLIELSNTFVRPLVLSSTEQSFIGSKEHGLDELRHGLKFTFKKGAIIAEGPYFMLENQVNSLFQLKKDGKAPSGTYWISHIENPDFIFQVHLAKDLWKAHKKVDPKADKMFMVGILASALSYLVRLNSENVEGDEDGDIVEQHSNLESLFKLLDDYEPNSWEKLKEDKRAVVRIASKHDGGISFIPKK